MPERAAAAGHMDQVVGAAQQAKALRVEQLQHVGHGRRFGHEVAFEHEALVAVGIARRMHAHFAEGLPHLAVRGAAGRDLARLGTAVNLDQHGAHRLFRLRGELRRQRRGGRKNQVDRRQCDARQQQRLEVERRGDQRARARHRGQRARDVGRKERPATVEGGAAEHGEQRRRLEAVAVLHRHCRHQRQAIERRALQQLGQTRHGRRHIAHQRLPALGMRLRHPGGARGEQADRMAPGLDQRYDRFAFGRCFGRAGQRHQHPMEARGRQLGIVGQRIGVAAGLGQTRERIGARIGRQQAGLPSHQRRRQTDRKGITVAAHVHDRPLRRQLRSQPRNVGQEGLPADRHAGAPGQRRAQVARAEQRQPAGAGDITHRSTPRSGAGAWNARTASTSRVRSNSGCRR